MAGESLSFLTWNLAMLQRPADAPADWSQEHAQEEVRRLVLELSPDLVLLQELPGVVPYVETHDMIRANPRSHSGNLATLVGHHLLDDEVSHSVIPGAALLVTFAALDLTVANVHLAPGPGGGAERLAQLAAVVGASPTSDLVIAGDTNTRTSEEPAIATLGLSTPRPPSPTWDGRRNRFRHDGGEFIAYFTRYFVAGAVTVGEVAVPADRAIRAGGRPFHLSDHYALAGVIGLVR